MPERKWWKEAVIYQIYPRSFKDSNGDGIGDLNGITGKLDYIASLGVDVVWLNPVYASPNEDNGYDISDFKSIMPQFGSMSDFEQLLRGLHDKGMKLILDLVINHVSSEHPWFQQARTSRANAYYPYFHWWPSEKGEPPYRESFFDPAGRGWQFNEPTNSFYLHYFSSKQPDLNWENKELRMKIYEIIRWWLDKGVDGFRMDAITFISKDANFPVITQQEIGEKFQGEWSHYYASGPRLHEYLREMHEQVFDHYDALILAEGPGILCHHALEFVDEERKELDMFTHFEGIGIGYVPGKFKKINPGGYDITAFKKVYSAWSNIFREKGWCTLYLGNHDQPRMVSRWGNDAPEFRTVSAKLLFTFLLSMRSTPFVYNGDEIGMTNIRFKKIDDYRDLETKRMYERILSSGSDVAEFLRDQELTARDNSRTPFQWNAEPLAGFTTGNPWISINENYREINLAAEENNPGSILHYFRKMLQFRKQWPALVYGPYQLLDSDPHLFVYLRTGEEIKLLVILNFSKINTGYRIDYSFDPGKDVLINNCTEFKLKEKTLSLLPYQAVILKIS